MDVDGAPQVPGIERPGNWHQGLNVYVRRGAAWAHGAAARAHAHAHALPAMRGPSVAGLRGCGGRFVVGRGRVPRLVIVINA